jgi:hypothetical protein
MERGSGATSARIGASGVASGACPIRAAISIKTCQDGFFLGCGGIMMESSIDRIKVEAAGV